jgi:F-type H+-transporting ATPase subunit a
MSTTQRGCLVLLLLIGVVAFVCVMPAFFWLPQMGIGVSLPPITLPAEVLIGNFPVWGFDFTNTHTSLLLVDAIVLLIAFVVNRAISGKALGTFVPRGFTNFMELLTEFLYNQARNLIGANVGKVFPVAASIFLFLLVANWVRLVPGNETVGIAHCGEPQFPGYLLHGKGDGIPGVLIRNDDLNIQGRVGIDVEYPDTVACEEKYPEYIPPKTVALKARGEYQPPPGYEHSEEGDHSEDGTDTEHGSTEDGSAPAEGEGTGGAPATGTEDAPATDGQSDAPASGEGNSEAPAEGEATPDATEGASTILTSFTPDGETADLGAGTEGGNPEVFMVTPYLRPLATDLNMPVALSLIVVVLVQFWGLSTLGISYIYKFINLPALGNISKKPLGAIDFGVGLLEIISELSRIVSLTFRLFGNIFAGAILVIVLSFLMGFLLPVPFGFLELFVGAVQAYVFATLTMIYASQAMTSHHHDDDHGHDDHGGDHH